MKLMRVAWVDYTTDASDELLVRVTGRGVDGERVVRRVEGTRPHFYVPADEEPPEETEDDEWEIVAERPGYETIDGRDAKRLVVGHPQDVNRLEEEFSWAYENDIPYYRRCTFDYGLSGYIRVPEDRDRVHISDIDREVDIDFEDRIPPRVLIGDIEVYDPDARSFDEMKEAVDAPIVAMTIYDSYDEEYVIMVVDEDDSVDPERTRERLADHWGDHDRAESMVDAEKILVQCETETDLLNTFVGEVQRRRPDITSGWNWVGFDWPYILERCRELDDVDHGKLVEFGSVQPYKGARGAPGLPAFDQMEGLSDKLSYSEKRSTALEFVAKDELGIGKLPGPSVVEDYDEDRSSLVAYNLLDVQLCVALDDIHGIEDFYLDLADMSSVQIYDTHYELRLVDGYIISRRDDDQVVPPQVETNNPTTGGGLVLTPSTGITEAVAVFDVKSLYPSTFITCNVSPETVVEDEDEADVIIPLMPETAEDAGGEITEDDIVWRPDEGAMLTTLDTQGVMPEYNADLFDRRDRYKALRSEYARGSIKWDVYDNQQNSVKVIQNSFYGVLNLDYSRWSQPGLGEFITSPSRYVLWTAKELAESWGYDVAYGDTDSLLLELDPSKSKKELLREGRGIATQLNDSIYRAADDMGIPRDHPYIDDSLHGTDQHCWKFEFEAVYDRFFQAGSKKRYAGRAIIEDEEILDTPELDIKGFEYKRADVPERTASVQHDVIDLVLDYAEFDELSGRVDVELVDIRTDDADVHEIGVPISLKQPLHRYGNIPRARAVRFSNEHLGTNFGVGDSPWMYYVESTPTFVPHTDVIALSWYDDIPEDYVVDYDKTAEKMFESALSPILDEVGYSWPEVRDGRRRGQAADESVTTYVDPFDDDGDDGGDSIETDDEPTGAGAW